MTDAEKQHRQREKAKRQRDLARDVIEFVRYLDMPARTTPDKEWGRMVDLKRRIRELHPEINIRAKDYVG